jgi:phosphate transport system substrate-binding protein
MSGEAPPPPAPDAPRVVRRRGDRGRIYLGLAVVAVAAIVVGVGAGTSWFGLRASGSSASCPTGVTLQGAGASFPAAIVSQWTNGYHASDANTVNYQNSGAGQGITDLTEKSVDFAITDEGLNATENSSLHAQVGTVLTLAVTGGAVVVIFHPPTGYAGPLNLSGQELAAIYLGSITTWSDSRLVANNPGLASYSSGITAVHRSDPAGMTYVLTTYLSQQNTTWRTNPSLGTTIDPTWPTFAGSDGASGNSAVLTAVRSTVGSVGYTDLYDAQVKSVATAAVVNSHGTAIPPTWADTSSAIADVYAEIGSSLPSPTGDWSKVSWVNASGAGDYPLAAIAYMLVPQNPGHGHTASATDAAALRQWIAWVVTSGQTYNTTQFPYVSPPAALLTEDLSALSGMNYNGAGLPAC